MSKAIDHPAIVCTPVPNDQRIQRVAQLFGFDFPRRIEPTIFAVAESQAREYSGGYWEFFDLSCEAWDADGFFLAPEPLDKVYHLTCPNGWEGELSGIGLGIVATLYVYSHESFKGGPVGKTCATLFHKLRAYAIEHPEARAIFGAID